MGILDQIKDKTRKLGRTVVLPEGYDQRTIQAARSLTEERIARVIILGKIGEVAKLAKTHGLDMGKITVINPADSPDFNRYANLLYERRKDKGITREKAAELMKNELYFGAALVKTGGADASDAGAANTTGDVLRAALHIIGLAEGIKVVSSCFLMTMPEFLGTKDKVFMFADCAVVPNPKPEELASIAASTAETYRRLIGDTPRVAFLSFSTKGSAEHEDIDKVRAALDIFRRSHPGVEADGEMQLDAAVIPKIGEKKAPGSPVAGKANVLIFPDLDAGNIGYKLTERMAQATATGPIIQGLALPANDLSRGCSSDDIVNVSAIAVLLKG